MSDEVEEEVFVPTGSEQFSPHRGLGVGVRVGDIEGQSAQDGEVCRGVVLAVAGEVFVECDVERPVQAVLDAPMVAHDVEQALGREALGEEEDASCRSLAVAAAFEAGDGSGRQCTIDTGGDLDCTGNITPSVSTALGRNVKLYSVASPENWFEDFGSGELTAGRTQISLDPTFASTIATEENYHVFLTPNGDCKGLYVASRTASGFEVRELAGGASNVSFDYRIVAKRRGYEKIRMEDVTDQINKLKRSAQARRANATGESESIASAPPRPVAIEVSPRRTREIEAAISPRDK